MTLELETEQPDTLPPTPHPIPNGLRTGEGVSLSIPGLLEQIRSVNWAERATIDILMGEIARFPLLNHKQEYLIFEHLRNASTLEMLFLDTKFVATIRPQTQPGTKFRPLFLESQDIYDLIINANLRLVAFETKNHIGLPFLDKFQEGQEGLRAAAEKFDHRLGFKFSTYATQWIMQRITRAIADQSTEIRIPVYMQQVVSTAGRQARNYLAVNGCYPDFNQLSQMLAEAGVKPSEIETLRHMTNEGVTNVSSLEKSLENGSDDENHTLGDILSTTNTTQGDSVVGTWRQEHQSADIDNALGTLTPRERQMIQLFVGWDEKEELNMSEIGREMGLSRERIRQILRQALGKLRKFPNLRVYWQEDVPPSLLDTEQTPKAKRQIEKPDGRQSNRGKKVDWAALRQQRQEKRYAERRQSLTELIQIPAVWSKIPADSRAFLQMYYRDPVLRPDNVARLARIYGFDQKDCERFADVAFNSLKTALADTIFN